MWLRRLQDLSDIAISLRYFQYWVSKYSHRLQDDCCSWWISEGLRHTLCESKYSIYQHTTLYLPDVASCTRISRLESCFDHILPREYRARLQSNTVMDSSEIATVMQSTTVMHSSEIAVKQRHAVNHHQDSSQHHQQSESACEQPLSGSRWW